MKIFLTILFGFIAGIAGGMGLGGGTFLIPLFQFLDYEQTAIQAINLISFLPMAVVALILHFKNGLVEKDGILWIIIPAAALAILGALLAKNTDVKILKICFGVFIVGVGIWEIIKSIKQMREEKNKKQTPAEY